MLPSMLLNLDAFTPTQFLIPKETETEDTMPLHMSLKFAPSLALVSLAIPV